MLLYGYKLVIKVEIECEKILLTKLIFQPMPGDVLKFMLIEYYLIQNYVFAHTLDLKICKIGD